QFGGPMTFPAQTFQPNPQFVHIIIRTALGISSNASVAEKV
ncbi:2650_t:CDS:1, partial [Racocetra fulgida]